MKFKSGDKVKYKDGDKRIFKVHSIYSDTELSLGLADYPEVEQDYLTNIKEIEGVKK